MTRKRKLWPLQLHDIDPFSRELARDAWERFSDARHEWTMRTSQEAWAGIMTIRFTDDELRLLEALGLFSHQDRGLLRRAGRSWESYPAAVEWVEQFYGRGPSTVWSGHQGRSVSRLETLREIVDPLDPMMVLFERALSDRIAFRVPSGEPE